MLGPAINRQPGFRRGLVEQSNAKKINPVGWLAGCLPGWLLARAVGWFGLGGWLWRAGRLAGCLLISFLTGWLTGWLADSLHLAGSVAVRH